MVAHTTFGYNSWEDTSYYSVTYRGALRTLLIRRLIYSSLGHFWCWQELVGHVFWLLTWALYKYQVLP